MKWLQIKLLKVLRFKESLGVVLEKLCFSQIQNTTIHIFGYNSPTITGLLLIYSFYGNLNETRFTEIISMIV